MAKKQGRNKDEHKVNAIPNGAVTIVPQQKLDPKLTQLFSSSVSEEKTNAKSHPDALATSLGQCREKGDRITRKGH